MDATITLLVVGAFGLTGAFVAIGKHRSPLGWFLLCGFTGLIGLVILLVLDKVEDG